MKLCQATPGATGCEVIKKPGGGCYVHTAPIAKGNNVADHACWVFSKCNKGDVPSSRDVVRYEPSEAQEVHEIM